MNIIDDDDEHEHSRPTASSLYHFDSHDTASGEMRKPAGEVPLARRAVSARGQEDATGDAPVAGAARHAPL